jgi:hypothetical protein
MTHVWGYRFLVLSDFSANPRTAVSSLPVYNNAPIKKVEIVLNLLGRGLVQGHALTFVSFRRKRNVTIPIEHGTSLFTLHMCMLLQYLNLTSKLNTPSGLN